MALLSAVPQAACSVAGRAVHGRSDTGVPVLTHVYQRLLNGTFAADWCIILHAWTRPPGLACLTRSEGHVTNTQLITLHLPPFLL